MKPKTKIRLFAVAALLLVVAVLAGIKVAQIRSMIKAGESFVMPPEVVTSTKVEASQWQPTQPAVASLVAVQSVQLTAELSGAVRRIGFESGTPVKKGALLVQIESAAEAAQLESAVAEASLAKVSLERAVQLRQAGSNSQQDLDTAQARAKQSDAAVASLRATIAKKTIRAPFDGRISIKQVEVGQVVAPGTPIASLQSVSPIYAEFSLPQQSLAELKTGQRVDLHTDTFPGAKWEGQLSTINSEVDVATRNVRLRATFENADGRLRPGMFANIDVLAHEKKSVIAIPATAVLYAPFGDSVFVLEEKKHEKTGKPVTVAQQKFIRLGERRGDFVAVDSGLAAGQTIVSSGAFKLRNGMEVAVNNQLAPKTDLSPKPVDDQ